MTWEDTSTRKDQGLKTEYRKPKDHSLIKMDSQGAEKTVLAGGELTRLDGCRAPVVEVHGAEAERIADERVRGRGVRRRQQGERPVHRREAPAAESAVA